MPKRKKHCPDCESLLKENKIENMYECTNDLCTYSVDVDNVDSDYSFRDYDINEDDDEALLEKIQKDSEKAVEKYWSK